MIYLGRRLIHPFSSKIVLVDFENANATSIPPLQTSVRLKCINVCLTALLNCFTAIYFIYYVHFFHTIIIMVTLCQVTIIQHSILKPTSSSDILLLYKECNKMDKISILKAKLTLWVEWEHNKIYHQQVYCWVKSHIHGTQP